MGGSVAEWLACCIDVKKRFMFFYILVTFLTFLTFFTFQAVFLKKRWQSSERQAD